MDSFFGTLQNNPSVAAGTCTFAVAFALVAGNAFYAQNGNHPDPIWATRDATVTQSVTPAVRPVKITRVDPKRIPVPAERADTRAKAKKSPLVEAIQAALVRSGDFNGEVDGMIGPVTRASISSYQARHNLKVTGRADAELLALIERDTPQIVASSDPLSGLIDSNQNAKYDRNLVQQIQAGIARSGLAEIEVDGIFGNQTKQAIEAFQRKNALEVDGKPSKQVLRKMLNLGLITQG